jgi:hypothetical protein
MHPVGTPASQSTTSSFGWNALGCCACNKIGIDDFAFANAMLDWAEQNLCVDISKVMPTCLVRYCSMFGKANGVAWHRFCIGAIINMVGYVQCS